MCLIIQSLDSKAFLESTQILHVSLYSSGVLSVYVGFSWDSGPVLMFLMVQIHSNLKLESEHLEYK